MKADAMQLLENAASDLKSIGAESVIDALLKHNQKLECLVEIAKEHRQLQDYVGELENRLSQMEQTIKIAQSENRI